MATFEAVHEAYRRLSDEGLPVSADRILKITGGSKQTVLAHLQVIRRGAGPATDLTDTADSLLHAAADPFLKKIRTAARQQAEAKFAGRIRDLLAVQVGLLDDVRDLSESNFALAKRADEAESNASMHRSQEDQLSRLLEIVEGLRMAGSEQKPERGGNSTVTPDRLAPMWSLVSLLLSNEALQGARLEEELEASGWKDTDIRRARSDALQEGLVVLKVTKKGRDLLKAVEELSSKTSVNDRGRR